MSTCKKHQCVITETITDDVFCGVCRTHELKQQLNFVEAEAEFYKKYAGKQTLTSDFQTADHMRLELITTRELVKSLKNALAHSLVNGGGYASVEAATEYVNKEFTLNAIRNIQNG
jgi:hypothetical protein